MFLRTCSSTHHQHTDQLQRGGCVSQSSSMVRWICENCCTPQPPALVSALHYFLKAFILCRRPDRIANMINCCVHENVIQAAPRKVYPWVAVYQGLKSRFSSEDLNDDTIWADNNRCNPIVFDPTNHKKYNAQVRYAIQAERKHQKPRI